AEPLTGRRHRRGTPRTAARRGPPARAAGSAVLLRRPGPSHSCSSTPRPIDPRIPGGEVLARVDEARLFVVEGRLDVRVRWVVRRPVLDQIAQTPLLATLGGPDLGLVALGDRVDVVVDRSRVERRVRSAGSVGTGLVLDAQPALADHAPGLLASNPAGVREVGGPLVELTEVEDGGRHGYPAISSSVKRRAVASVFAGRPRSHMTVPTSPASLAAAVIVQRSPASTAVDVSTGSCSSRDSP